MGAHRAVGVIVSILGLLTCLSACEVPNPLVRARPPDVLAWDEARLADSPYFYQRFLTQYPTSAFARHARARLEVLAWTEAQYIDGAGDYARFIQAYPESVRVPQAQARLEELIHVQDRRQREHEVLSCPQLEARVRAYTAAVEQALAAMAQLPPAQRQGPRLSATDLPQLRAVFQAIRAYQSTVAAVQATYGALPACHTLHREIVYAALPTAEGRMLLQHLPPYGQVRGELDLAKPRVAHGRGGARSGALARGQMRWRRCAYAVRWHWRHWAYARRPRLVVCTVCVWGV